MSQFNPSLPLSTR